MSTLYTFLCSESPALAGVLGAETFWWTSETLDVAVVHVFGLTHKSKLLTRSFGWPGRAALGETDRYVFEAVDLGMCSTYFLYANSQKIRLPVPVSSQTAAGHSLSR